MGLPRMQELFEWDSDIVPTKRKTKRVFYIEPKLMIVGIFEEAALAVGIMDFHDNYIAKVTMREIHDKVISIETNLAFPYLLI